MNILETTNLAELIKGQLPSELAAFIRLAGEAAEKRQQRLYLVGGVVRDLFLERLNTDIDMVVEGDAIKLAEEIAVGKGVKVITHARFGTATLKWGSRSADFATARSETYARPGALPKVRSGTIHDDLARRDFSINAMAGELNPRHFGELIDPFGGRQDLARKAIRVLHAKSFTDDATRIWRALRYEQRLGFQIEPMTLLLIERDLPMLKTISGDRLRHELELVFREELPEKVLLRADELDVLAQLHPSLVGNEWLARAFVAARERAEKDAPDPLYTALLCYHLTPSQMEKLAGFLHFPAETLQVLRDTLAIKQKVKNLTEPGQAPSVLYNLLHGYHLTALTAASITSGDVLAAEHIELYLNVLRHVHPALTGDDLKNMGVPAGPKIKKLLQLLREARLDGKIDTKKGEEEMVRELIK
ncbi:MAG: CCA tRNA nucleotidyltransferase [Dehalococcoidales bacterium]|jgi:tRNA nucleotidyltransferase (CCA-adding enzyme)